jgi:hypothetical protein
MKRLGRRVRRAALAASSLLALVACGSSSVVPTTVQCGACPGDYLDPNGLIGPSDQVAGIRVCIDGACRTEQHTGPERGQGWHYNITGVHPPNRHHIESLEVTTFDIHNKVIRLATGTSIDLPTLPSTSVYSCACSGFKMAYDKAAGRFVITAQ